MNNINIEDNKNNIIKKHNELVNKARYSLSEKGIKIVSTLIAMIRKDDKDFQEYNIKISEFNNLINCKTNNYKNIHDLIKEILKVNLKLGDEQMNFCYYGKYIEGQAIVTFKIAPELKPYLLELKSDFVQYNIKDILSLKSAYVIRLYELMIQEFKQYMSYNKNAKSFTFDINIENIRNLFEIPSSYSYKDIRVNIIDKAQKQFLQKTNIKFTYSEYKIGRKVSKIITVIQENIKGSNDVLISLKSFITWIRKDYKNIDLFSTLPDAKIQQCISCNAEGKLYDKFQNETIDNKRSQEIWEKLYQLTKDGKLDFIRN